jgi:PTH2 family peptidyl-tRNA hydrolase
MGLKQVIVIRDDLDLPRGKLAAQVAHAAVEASHRSEATEAWRDAGQKKIVVKALDLTELQSIKEAADANDLATALITDAGKTIIAPGTITCLGIGPADEAKIDKVTGGLSLV